ncbi:M13 family metallopeptidase [Vicingaceae bacterium]|nr:M13 family metallopeptidase [Vicingaceae bacterium]
MKNLLLPLIAGIALISCDRSTKDNTEASVKQATAFSLSNLDTTVSPCDDFYHYAIGGWLRDNLIPSTESRWSSFNVVTDSNNAKLKKIFNEFSAKEFEKGSIEQKIGDFYKSVLDSTTAEYRGLEPLDRLLTELDEVSTMEDYVELTSSWRQFGISSFSNLYIGQDDKNSSEYITFLSQGGLGLPDVSYYTKSDEKAVEIQNAYKDFLVNILSLAKAENPEKAAITIFNMEKSLAEISMTRVERRDPELTYNKLSFSELQKLTSEINWGSQFSLIGLNNVQNVVVGQPNFFKGLNKMLKDIPVSDWKVYSRWKLIDAYASNLSSEFVNAYFGFFGKTLSGTEVIKSREERALRQVNSGLGELVGKAFVERHFQEESKADVRQMVENLRTVFKERVKELDWMSEETKLKALGKLDAFNMKIGYPDKWTDFSNLYITKDDLVQNVMNIRKFNFDKMIEKIGKPVDQDEWFMTPQTVNAYYSSSQNEIVFPAGILQPPFYSLDADEALNYGGIGAVIGHEFSHGFDDQGSKYDAKGNLANWWTEEDRARFDARANAVVKQFDGYFPLADLHVNGSLTLGENIADLGGATMAFYALEKELERVGKPEPIDGFNYQQRFFLGWAQVWHMNMTEKELRKRIATDSHSPGEYRVKGPLANMSEFAEAFGCSASDPMVNTDSAKAVIW